MRSVHIRIGHDDDAVIAYLGDVEILPDASSDGYGEVLDLLMVQELVRTGLLDVEDLSSEREDGLERAVPSLLGASSCGVSLHDVQLALRGIPLGAVGELPGKAGGLEDALPPGGVPGLPGGLPALVGGDGLLEDDLSHGGVLEQVLVELLGHESHDRSLGDAASELGLGLSLELGLGHLDADDRGEPLADVRPFQGGVLEDVVGLPVVVQALGQSGPEPGEVGSSLGGVDGVHEGVDLLVVPVGVLQGDVDVDVVPLAREMDGDGVYGRLGPVEVLHELGNTAVVVEPLLLARTLVLEVDGGLLVEERLVAEPVLEGGVVEGDGLEHLGVRPECDLGTVPVGVAYDLHRAVGDADLVRLPEDLPFAVHDRHELGRKGVHDRDSHSVESSGDLVAVLVELSSGVKVGKAHLQSGLALLVVDSCGDSPSVVHDRYGAVLVDDNVHLRGESGHDLVYSVVHDLVDHVV